MFRWTRLFAESVLVLLIGITIEVKMTQLTNDVENNIKLVVTLATKSFPQNKVLRDLTVCQAVLEGGLLGVPSKLAIQYNNLFGIKEEGTNGTVVLMSEEYVKGKPIRTGEAFAWNNDVEDSIQQHASVLSLPRYQNLHTAASFEEAALLIQKDGYATDPKYSHELVSVYNELVKNAYL